MSNDGKGCCTPEVEGWEGDPGEMGSSGVVAEGFGEVAGVVKGVGVRERKNDVIDVCFPVVCWSSITFRRIIRRLS